VKKVLRIIAVILVVAAAGFWLAAGANRGWTKTSVPKKTLDEVTGIEGVTYENKFVPGVDFLGAAVIGAGILAGASFFFRNKKQTHTPNQTQHT
jgi:thymidine phosphorylase